MVVTDRFHSIKMNHTVHVSTKWQLWYRRQIQLLCSMDFFYPDVSIRSGNRLALHIRQANTRTNVNHTLRGQMAPLNRNGLNSSKPMFVRKSGHNFFRLAERQAIISIKADLLSTELVNTMWWIFCNRFTQRLCTRVRRTKTEPHSFYHWFLKHNQSFHVICCLVSRPLSPDGRVLLRWFPGRIYIIEYLPWTWWFWSAIQQPSTQLVNNFKGIALNWHTTIAFIRRTHFDFGSCR